MPEQTHRPGNRRMHTQACRVTSAHLEFALLAVVARSEIRPASRRITSSGASGIGIDIDVCGGAGDATKSRTDQAAGKHALRFTTCLDVRGLEAVQFELAPTCNEGRGLLQLRCRALGGSESLLGGRTRWASLHTFQANHVHLRVGKVPSRSKFPDRPLKYPPPSSVRLASDRRRRCSFRTGAESDSSSRLACAG